MSTAHRPTWEPAQAKDVKGGSRQFSARDMAAHTKLKFRQPGQTSVDEVVKRDLRADLLLAEQAAREKKRKAEGKPPLAVENASTAAGQDDESNKRRRLLQEALELDKDDDDEEKSDKNDMGDKDEDNDEDDDDDDDDEDEDDTAELLRELEKIKRERAEEKERQEREQSASATAAREAEIANLIFKNQAMSARDKDKASGKFVNDLLRTEFHKKFMAKFIKESRDHDASWIQSLVKRELSDDDHDRENYSPHTSHDVMNSGHGDGCDLFPVFVQISKQAKRRVTGGR
ncbi:predicted protein [Postia placenta Mad-698-R]|uniref:Cwf15/Cwc15 cell cycle control protein n=1 Tax=Postia placenta MAD-698-R-SB12 TaxID=670580 RepID=A0A1X6MZM3_9APHY|nr:hypothetical protein POSPLADRAFT_1144653 [Postia placenta MAD-698-R-SB12]EED79473.1 predicted protein [Postia placenta Mad-698-R]OSX61814.1 hypothetical protein POSPLADRAFT_1144653 [Postia placenta MAD-698-R-SB12]